MLWWLTQHLLVTAGLAAVVALACRIGRLSPALRHALWLLVLVKLLVPPLIALPWPESAPNSPIVESRLLAPPAGVLPATKDVPLPPTSERLVESPSIGSHTPPPVLVNEPRPAAASDPRASPPTGVPPPAHPAPPGLTALPGWSWTEFGLLACLTGWVTGSLVTATLHALRVCRFQRQVWAAKPAPRWLKRLVRELAGKFPVRPPRTRMVAGLSSPVIWCLGRPTLLWPVSLLDPAQPQRWRGVVAHELAHLRRRDHWVGWLLLVGECLWWWNPLLWLVRRQLRLHAELACDAWVVWALPEDRRPYAQALIEVTEHVAATLPAPVLGIGHGARQALQRRLTMIMCESVPCRVPVRGLLLAGLLALLLVPAWTFGDDAPLRSKTDKNQEIEAALKQALAEFEAKKQQLEDKLSQLKKQLAELESAKQQDQVQKEALQLTAHTLRTRLSDLENQYASLVINRRIQAAGLLGNLDVRNQPRQPRHWGAEQATGAPNVAGQGDDMRGWASLTEDDQDEWLCLEYAEAVTPLAVVVYETYNPGALWKVSLFTEDDRELEVWKGSDPTPPGSGKGVSLIQLKIDFRDLKTKKVKLYLKSTEVKGWNEIDAVGLLDSTGKLQWGTAATASSSYADRLAPSAADTGFPPDTDPRINLNEWVRQIENRRLQQMEDEFRQLKATVDRLADGKPGGAGSMGTFRSLVKPPASDNPDDPIQRLTQENKVLRDKLDRFERILLDLQKRLEKGSS